MAFFCRKPTQGSYWGPKYTSCILYLVNWVETPILNVTMELQKMSSSAIRPLFLLLSVTDSLHSNHFIESCGGGGVGPIALGCITKIYQAIYSTGYIPKELCKSRVVFIPKPQKADYGEAGSFRPISLTQFLFKAMNVWQWWPWDRSYLITPIQPKNWVECHYVRSWN